MEYRLSLLFIILVIFSTLSFADCGSAAKTYSADEDAFQGEFCQEALWDSGNNDAKCHDVDTSYPTLLSAYPVKPFETEDGDYLISVVKSISYSDSTRHPEKKFRVFIPPGTKEISQKIKGKDSLNYAYARMNKPVDSNVLGVWETAAPSPDVKISDLKKGTQKINSLTGSIVVISQKFNSPLKESGAGWIYVEYPDSFSHLTGESIGITVDKEVYDSWRSGIDWQKDVENTYCYSQSSSLNVKHVCNEVDNGYTFFGEGMQDDEGGSYEPSKLRVDDNTLLYYAGRDRNDPLSKYRVFLPPGAKKISAYVYGYADSEFTAYLSMNNPPDIAEAFDETPTIDGLLSGKTYKVNSYDGAGFLLNLDFSESLPEEKSGWIYIDTGLTESEITSETINLYMHKQDYVTWWENSGSNSDGSINWENDVMDEYCYGMASNGKKKNTISYQPLQGFEIFPINYPKNPYKLDDRYGGNFGQISKQVHIHESYGPDEPMDKFGLFLPPGTMQAECHALTSRGSCIVRGIVTAMSFNKRPSDEFPQASQTLEKKEVSFSDLLKGTEYKAVNCGTLDYFDFDFFEEPLAPEDAGFIYFDHNKMETACTKTTDEYGRTASSCYPITSQTCQIILDLDVYGNWYDATGGDPEKKYYLGPQFPTPGESVSWQCDDNGVTSTCTAKRRWPHDINPLFFLVGDKQILIN